MMTPFEQAILEAENEEFYDDLVEDEYEDNIIDSLLVTDDDIEDIQNALQDKVEGGSL